MSPFPAAQAGSDEGETGSAAVGAELSSLHQVATISAILAADRPSP